MIHSRSTVLLAAAAASALVTVPEKARPRAIQSFNPRADVNDPAKILADLQKAFADFKAENDVRLKGKADVLAEEKVERINTAVADLQAAIDEMSKKLAAQTINGADDPKADTPQRRAYAKAFNAAFRRGGGQNADAELQALAVQAAMTTQSDPDGGWLVPTQMETTIDRVLATVSAMRNLSRVMPISAPEYKKLVNVGGTQSGWTSETGPRGQTDGSKLTELVFNAKELWAQPAATQTLLDDSAVDIAQWIADEVVIEFAEQEGSAFITGNGVGQPKGILSYATTADTAVTPWGKIGFYGTGGAGFAADPDGIDALIDLTQGLKQGYRQNASFLANRFTVGKMRKLKDDQGHYQWQPSSQLGVAPTFLGYKIADDDNMPDVGAGAFPVAFADFNRAYLIVDRMGIRVLRDPYTAKPYVLFYTTKRVGGGVQNFEAIKLLKCA